MKKITIFAFIGLIFIGGIVFVPQAKAEVTASSYEISPAEAKILKQTLDVLGLVLKDIEARVSKGEFSSEKKVVVQASLSNIKGSLVGVDNLVKNYAVTNYPGSGSLSVESGNQQPVVVSQTEDEETSKKSALASLWATVWPGKLVGIVLLFSAAVLIIVSSKKKRQLAT